jgi:hypothetical protein
VLSAPFCTASLTTRRHYLFCNYCREWPGARSEELR